MRIAHTLGVVSTSIDRGTQVGRFVVVRELGRGGMGAVYAAHDPQLDRQVALKVMRDASGSEEDRVRMLREGRAMARVTHPNVITVYEVGTEGNAVFLAQELLDGGTLAKWLEQPRPQRAIIAKLIAAGRGLAAAHAVGLVHRDFKPENVLLGKDGRLRVADFGLARTEATTGEALASTNRGGGPPRDEDDVTHSPMSQLTRTGAVMGTPMFMAPEQHRGERADARSDQFAFAVSLYHALYKAWPYDGKTAPALADAVIEGRLAPPPSSSQVSPSMRKILLRGLATDPAQRYPSIAAMLVELEREIGAAPRNRTPLLLAGAALVVVTGAVGAIAVIEGREARRAPVVTAPTPVTVPGEAELLTTEKDITRLTTAIDRGQFAEAIETYDLAATLALKNNVPARAALAEAASAYMSVLRGDLALGEETLVRATQHAGGDSIALAYVDLAESALALARGQLPAARDRSKRCATQLAPTAPVLAAICHQLEGESQAALGESAAARAAYQAGLELAKTSGERQSTLQLAVAQLELDAQKTQQAAAIATKVQSECSDRGAIGCDVHARILLARVRLGESAFEAAAELLTSVKPTAIEAAPVRIAHAIALGEVYGYTNESTDERTGLARIEQARSEAETRKLKLLMLEAKLVRLRVQLVNDAPEARDEHAALVKQARTDKIERIAKLANSALKELSGSPGDMLPSDGGLPVVRTGSSGAP